MGRATHKRTPDRRREIIEAALACFAEVGFDAATMADIRSRSGASIGSIYHHFAGKDELAAAVYADGIADFQAGVLRVLEASDDAEAGVAGVVRYHARWVQKHPQWATFLFRQRHAGFMAGSESGIRARNREFMQKLKVWLEDRQATGELRAMPTDLFLCILLGPSQEFARHALAGRLASGWKNAADALARAAWHALGNERKGKNRSGS